MKSLLIQIKDDKTVLITSSGGVSILEAIRYCIATKELLQTYQKEDLLGKVEGITHE